PLTSTFLVTTQSPFRDTLNSTSSGSLNGSPFLYCCHLPLSVRFQISSFAVAASTSVPSLKVYLVSFAPSRPGYILSEPSVVSLGWSFGYFSILPSGRHFSSLLPAAFFVTISPSLSTSMSPRMVSPVGLPSLYSYQLLPSCRHSAPSGRTILVGLGGSFLS